MNYDEALKYIHNTLKFGSKLGLESIKNLMEELGNPQDSLKFVHVAGTNGKGSTCVMISEILRKNGLKVGLYTSPYIQEFTERIQVNGEKIKKNALGDIVDKIKEAIQNMCKAGYKHPTEFEIVTAAAFVYFYQEKCDIVVLEVGLGGRFDATNIIKNPVVSVITSISKDHMQQLGNTIDKIAYEKCGIIKDNGNVVVYGKQDKLALKTIKEVSDDKNAVIYMSEQKNIVIESDTIDGISFSYKNCKDIKLKMTGTYQAYNAATAIETVYVLNDKLNLNINCKTIKEGLLEVKWPGRFEICKNNPTVIMDGAHNLEAVKNLKELLNKYVNNRRLILLVSFMKDKEYKQCLKEMCPDAHFIVATAPKLERALEPNKLKEEIIKYNKNCISIEDSVEGYIYALNKAKPEDVICCFGSFYLISEIRDKNIDLGRK